MTEVSLFLSQIPPLPWSLHVKTQWRKVLDTALQFFSICYRHPHVLSHNTAIAGHYNSASIKRALTFDLHHCLKYNTVHRRLVTETEETYWRRRGRGETTLSHEAIITRRGYMHGAGCIGWFHTLPGRRIYHGTEERD